MPDIQFTPEQVQEIMAQNAKLVAANAALAASVANSAKPIYMKVSEKGAASLYGLGRMPVTLYKGQWEKLFANEEMIKQFLADNVATLSDKANAKAASVAEKAAA